MIAIHKNFLVFSAFLISQILMGCLFIASIMFWSLFAYTFLNSIKINGTLLDYLFQIDIGQGGMNIIYSLFLIFLLIAIISMVIFVLSFFIKNIYVFFFKVVTLLFLPCWITLWMIMSLDELGFTVITSIISFLALLSPLTKRLAQKVAQNTQEKIETKLTSK